MVARFELVENNLRPGGDVAVEDAVVFGVEIFGELIDAFQAAGIAFFAVWTAETIRIRHEMRAVAEMSVTAAIAKARSDRRRRSAGRTP